MSMPDLINLQFKAFVLTVFVPILALVPVGMGYLVLEMFGLKAHRRWKIFPMISFNVWMAVAYVQIVAFAASVMWIVIVGR